MPRGPFVPIPNTAKVELIGHDIGDNKPSVVVMHCEFPNTGSAADATGVAGAYNTFLQNMSAHTSGEQQWDEIRVTDLNSATGPQVTVPTTHGGSGGDAPPGLSVVFFEHTILRGRSFTGRHFWPVDFGDVTMATGDVGATTIAQIPVQYATLQADLAALAIASTSVVASRKLHVSHPVALVIVRPEIGRIRRRAFG